MKFKIRCKRKGESDSQSWWEEYDKDIDDATKWGKETIKWFNETCSVGEKRRVFIEAVVLEENTIKDHTWIKTNSFTIITRHSSHDTMRCEKCNITGKRFGLGQNGVKIDSKFRAKRHIRCDTSLAYMDEHR